MSVIFLELTVTANDYPALLTEEHMTLFFFAKRIRDISIVLFRPIKSG